MKIKVSIIVAIYNAERYLEKCLQSLMDQTLKEIEIICINDGSTDKSKKILEKYARIDKRIIVINKENTGYGDSLNCGIKSAKGEYIAFLDSDDFIKNTMYEKLYNIGIKTKVDIVKSKYLLWWENKISQRKWEIKELHCDKIINKPRNVKEFFYLPPSIWTSIYKSSFLKANKIDFLDTPRASYQDISFAFKTIAKAKSIWMTKEELLFYRQDNLNSSVKNLDKGRIFAVFKEYDEVERWLKEENLFSEFKNRFAENKIMGLFWILENIREEYREEYKIKMKKDVMNVLLYNEITFWDLLCNFRGKTCFKLCVFLSGFYCLMPYFKYSYTFFTGLKKKNSKKGD